MRDIPIKIVEIKLDKSTVLSNQSPQPTYQNSPNFSNINNNPSPQPVGKGNIKLGASILQRACRDDFDAIATMFQQFIPQDEQIHIARYLGRRGLCGIGNRHFACVTDKRVAHITTGYFGKVAYQDGYLEDINSGAIYQPPRFLFYFFLFISLSILAVTLFPLLTLLFHNGNPNINIDSISQNVISIINIILGLLIPVAAQWFYSILKSELVLTIRESQIYLNPFGGFAFGQRLIYIFANPKFVARANSIYRYFIIQKETRLNQIKKYPLFNQQKNLSPLTAIPLSSSLQNYPDHYARNGVIAGLGVGALGLVGISLAALSKNLQIPFSEPTNTPSPVDIITPSPSPTEFKPVEDIEEELDNAICQELGENPICEQDLVYQVVTNQDSMIIAYKPLNKVSSDNFSRTPLPKLIASTNISSDQEPYALLQVVFKANGELEVTALQVLKVPQYL
ncbi:MAG: hypothetical protein N2235_04065 [Fischerella sp.]|nr:hypothetical protein [Fischerella sp.]